MKQAKKVCWQCGELRDRCRAVTVRRPAEDGDSGEVEYCCPKCWRDLDMDHYVRTGKGDNE